MSIHFQYDPNDPESYERERSKAYFQFGLTFFLFIGTLGSIIYFVFSLLSFLKDDYSMDLLYSFGLVVLMGVFIFLFVSPKGTRKESSFKYFLFLIGGIIIASGIISIIHSTYNLCHRLEDARRLLYSIAVVIVSALIIFLLYLKFEKRERFISNSKAKYKATQELSSDSCDRYIYCYKCGKKMPSDSSFCDSCGTNIQER